MQTKRFKSVNYNLTSLWISENPLPPKFIPANPDRSPKFMPGLDPLEDADVCVVFVPG